jgi:DNA polymerase-3 subunit beta
MALSCVVKQPHLAAGLSQAVRAVGNDRAHLAIIRNVLLSAEGSTLRVGATDMTNSVQAWIPVDSAEHGAFTVPAKLFTDYVTQLPPDDVRLSLDGAVLTVRCGRSTARFKGADADGYPELPQPPQDGWDLPLAVLRAIGSRVTPHANAVQGHAIMGGVSLDGSPGKLRARGSDSFRWAEEWYEADVDGHFEVVCTKAGARLLSEVFAGEQGACSLSLLPSPQNASHLCIEAPHLFATTRLLEGKYPDLGRMLPESYATTAAVNRAVLLAEVRRMLPLGGMERGVASFTKLRCRVTPDSLGLEVEGDETGNAEGYVAANVEGPALRFVVAAGLLTEILSGLPGETVLLSANPASPVRVVDPTLPAYHGVVMPISDAWLSAPDESGESAESGQP